MKLISNKKCDHVFVDFQCFLSKLRGPFWRTADLNWWFIVLNLYNQCELHEWWFCKKCWYTVYSNDFAIVPFIFLSIMSRDLSKEMLMCRWKNTKKILKWRTKKCSFWNYWWIIFFCNFFSHVFFFYIRCKYGRINNLNNIQCRYWIGGRCGWIADLNYHLQHWNSCLTVARQNCLDCPRWSRIGRRISPVFLSDWLFSFWYWFRFKVLNSWNFSSFWNNEK